MSKLSTNTTSLQSILETINNLPEAGDGVSLPELSTPATADEIFLGEEAIDGDGNKITGTFSITNEISAQNDLIAQIQSEVDNLPEAGSGGGGDTDMEDGLLMGTLTRYSNDRVTSIKSYAFQEDMNLTNISCSNCVRIEPFAFNMSYLEIANFPACEQLGEAAFADCYHLTTINLPKCRNLGGYSLTYSGIQSIDLPSYEEGVSALGSCENLVSVYLGSNDTQKRNHLISAGMFAYDINLTNLTLRYPFVIPLEDTYAFEGTPIADSSFTGSYGSIYVPASLVDEYKTATNWAAYADRITAIIE